ncbi:MAG: hypothetical protein AB1758_37030, partial [Candidatus Eremiobacterota bacterium]
MNGIRFSPFTYWRTPEASRWERFHRAEDVLRSHHDGDGLRELDGLRWRVVHDPNPPSWTNLALAGGTLALGAAGLALGGILGAGFGLVTGLIGTGGAVLGLTRVARQIALWRQVERIEEEYAGKPLPTFSPALSPAASRPASVSPEEVQQNLSRYYSQDDLRNAALKAALKDDSGALKRIETSVQARILLDRGVREGLEVHTFWAYPNAGGDAADPLCDRERGILYTSVGNRERSHLVALNSQGELLWSCPD